MKVMIVDDEENIRLGIAHGIDWAELGLSLTAVAENGLEALDMAALHHPDIILLDINMPMMDGLTFMRESRPLLPRAIYIVLSGHDEFGYAQQAIQYGVNEYLLKPISPRELIDALLKAKAQLEVHRDQEAFIASLEMTIEASMPILREKVIADLLHARYSPVDIEERLAYVGLHFPSPMFAALIIEVGSFLVRRGSQESDRQLTLFAVRNISEEVVNASHYGQSVIAMNSTVEVLVCFQPEPALDYKQALLQLASAIKENTEALLKISVTISAGNVYAGLDQIHYSCEAAARALKLSAVLGNGLLVDAERLEQAETSAIGYSLEREMEWMQYLRGGNDRAIAVWETIFADIAAGDPLSAYDEMKTAVHQMLLSLPKVFTSSGWSLADTRYAELYGKLHHYQEIPMWEKEMLALLRECLAIANRAKSSQYRREIEEVKQWIDRMYGTEISLQQLSASVFMNTNYLCSLFKAEVGETIHQYIIRVRMEKAKALLLGADLKIFEVAEQVGFSNTSYFSQAFKKYTGVSPNEYKGN